MLKEVILTISRVGVLRRSGPLQSPGNALKEYEAAGRTLKIPIQPCWYEVPIRIQVRAFREAARGAARPLW